MIFDHSFLAIAFILCSFPDIQVFFIPLNRILLIKCCYISNLSYFAFQKEFLPIKYSNFFISVRAFHGTAVTLFHSPLFILRKHGISSNFLSQHRHYQMLYRILMKIMLKPYISIHRINILRYHTQQCSFLIFSIHFCC